MSRDYIRDLAKYRKGWTGGLPETACGFGSRRSETKIQRLAIPQWVERYGIETIADIGAGDLNWMPLIEWRSPVVVRHYDLVPRHPDVAPLDLLADELPHADCLMLLWVLNHLPPEDRAVAKEKILAADARWLLMTWDERLPDLDLPPVEQVAIRGAGPSRPTQWLRLCRL